jgi:hypothetical protein
VQSDAHVSEKGLHLCFAPIPPERDKPLEIVTHISDLGVIVSKDLSWANHIEYIRTKANKTLGLTKRVCARDVVDANTRKLLYCAVVTT